MVKWVATITLLSAVAGCDQTPDDLRGWQPSDHHHNAPEPVSTSVPSRQPTPAGAVPPGSNGSSDRPRGAPPVDLVVLAAWKEQCARCHGRFGRGDGPEGRMNGAADLSRPDWQMSRSDQQIAAVIRAGRGKMPAFDLPDSTVSGLVKLVRMMGGQGERPQSATPNPSGAPPAPATASEPAPARPAATPAAAASPQDTAGAP